MWETNLETAGFNLKQVLSDRIECVLHMRMCQDLRSTVTWIEDGL